MKNLKLYIVISGLFIALAISNYLLTAANKKKANEIQRLKDNQGQLVNDTLRIYDLYFKEKEVQGRIKRERDSLAAALKIKPKQIIKYVVTYNTIHDTIHKPVPVYLERKNYWHIVDEFPCGSYEADVTLVNDSLNFIRTLYNHENETAQIFTRKRPVKIWFVELGKWRYYQHLSSKCGKPEVRTINFIKSKP